MKNICICALLLCLSACSPALEESAFSGNWVYDKKATMEQYKDRPMMPILIDILLRPSEVEEYFIDTSLGTYATARRGIFTGMDYQVESLEGNTLTISTHGAKAVFLYIDENTLHKQVNLFQGTGIATIPVRLILRKIQ